MNTKELRIAGFTLPEIIIAVGASGLVIIGIALFMVKIQADITSASIRAEMYTGLSRVSEKIREARREYPETILIDRGVSAYDVVVLTNSGKTSGMMLGVVDATTSTGVAYLDPESNFSTYGKKVLAFMPMSEEQIVSAISNSGSVATVPVTEDSRFDGLLVEKFQVVLYNSGTVVDSSIRIGEGYFGRLAGQPTYQIPTGNPLDYVLNF